MEEGDLIKPYEKPWDTSGPLSAQLIREIVARELRQELEEASAADLHFRLQSIFSPKASNASSQEPDHGKFFILFFEEQRLARAYLKWVLGVKGICEPKLE